MPQKTSEPVENTSAFKHWINKQLLVKMADALVSADASFNKKALIALEKDLLPLELKPRVQKISTTLKDLLPSDYVKALKILVKSLDKSSLSGFDLWPYTEFVQTYGLDHFKESMNALYLLTQKFTAEFAVRPFIAQDPSASYKLLKIWAQDKNHHVRRLSSEGSRPRLPWGLRLKDAVQDPSAGLEILELLKFDPELYVRKSVANHLNDISKDHPDEVLKTLKGWQKQVQTEDQQQRLDWIQKQALRSLIKQGYKPALKHVGSAHGAKVKLSNFSLDKKTYKVGDSIQIHFELHSTTNKAQNLIVDYIVHYMKSNKTTSPKVFKLKSFKIDGKKSVNIQKKHSLKPVTTRKLYPGNHRIEIQVNGQVLGKLSWVLRNS